jgi:hypothetical protein
MSSQSSFDEASTPAELPSTPQLLDMSLPASQDIPRALSQTTSMAVGEGSQLTERPAGIHSSITPPPSSQAPDLRFPIDSRRTASQSGALSSPPPTLINGVKRNISNGAAMHRPTAEQLENATEVELRDMVKNVIAENENLELVASEGRMSAAHFKLQYTLLSIETEEAAKRMQVEHDMTRQEVIYLNHEKEGRATTPAGQEYVARLKALGQSLVQENIALNKRLNAFEGRKYSLAPTHPGQPRPSQSSPQPWWSLPHHFTEATIAKLPRDPTTISRHTEAYPHDWTFYPSRA